MEISENFVAFSEYMNFNVKKIGRFFQNFVVFSEYLNFKVKTLDTLLKENGEFGRRITYLKVDVEGYEIPCLKQWLKSGVVNFIDQLGIEMHTGDIAYSNGVLKGILSFFRKILDQHQLHLVDYNPNLCVGKSSDKQKKYYTYHDLLFVKK